MSLNQIWVVADGLETVKELCAGAAALGGNISIIRLNPAVDAATAGALGASMLYVPSLANDSALVESCASGIATLAQEKKPELILIENSKRGRLISGILAAQLQTSALTDVNALSSDAGIKSERLVFGGVGVRNEGCIAATAIAVIGPGVLSPGQPKATTCREETFQVTPDARIKRLKTTPKESKSVQLGAAKKIIAVGRGIANQSDLAMIEELAGLMGAELACTRPIAEGENWMARDRYLGVSGAMVKPDLYIAIGISGQIQHMVGCNQSKTIISINKDKNAPVFAQSDYGMVGDLYQVVPEMIALLKNR